MAALRKVIMNVPKRNINASKLITDSYSNFVENIPRKEILMCPPQEFKVGIHLQNAHMDMAREVSPNKAFRQWCNLYNILTQKCDVNVSLISPEILMADMVFAANGALVKDNKALVANFAVPARKGETSGYLKYFKNIGSML